MYMKLKHPIPSIKQMGEFELPNFAVLIGRNGVGKTRLLKAIADGSVEVSGISKLDIEEYDINSFQPSDSGRGQWGHSYFFHVTAERYFSPKSGPSLVTVFENIFHETLKTWSLDEDPDERRAFEEAVRTVIRNVPDFSTIEKMKDEGPVDAYLNSIRNEVINKLESEEQRTESRRDKQEGSFNNSQAVLVCQALKLSGKLPHELSREDIRRASHYEGGTISNQLSQAFARYKAEQYAWAHTESETSNKTVQRLMEEYRDANTPPWEALRANLDRMREASDDPKLFDFEFSDPEEDRLSC